MRVRESALLLSVTLNNESGVFFSLEFNKETQKRTSQGGYFCSNGV